MDPKYRTTEEKVSDIERYLVMQVDAIKRWVMAAFVLAALAACAAIYVAVTARASAPEAGEMADAASTIDAEHASDAADAGSAENDDAGDLASADPATDDATDDATDAATDAASVSSSADRGATKPGRTTPDEAPGASRTPPKAAPKAAAPKQTAPEQAAPRVTATQPAAPKQTAPEQAAPRVTATQPAAPKKTAAEPGATPTGRDGSASSSRASSDPADTGRASTDRPGSTGIEADAELAAAWRERVEASGNGARPADAAPRTPDEVRSSPSRPASTGTDTSPAPTLLDETWTFRVGASAIAKSVDELEPVGAGTDFPADQFRLFCWTRIETDDLGPIPEKDRYVIHRWIHGGDVVKEQTITIGSPKYRVYSMVGAVRDRPGPWRVEIYDAIGRKIETLRFTVG